MGFSEKLGGLAYPSALSVRNSLGWSAVIGVRPVTDLDEHQRVSAPIEHHEVDFTQPSGVVARNGL